MDPNFGNEMDPMFDAEFEDIDFDDIDHDLFDLSYDDLQDQMFKTNEHFSHLPKEERGMARKEYQKDLRGRYRKTQKYKSILESQDGFNLIEQRGLPGTNPGSGKSPQHVSSTVVKTAYPGYAKIFIFLDCQSNYTRFSRQIF